MRLLPALSAARRQGQRTTCQSRLREVSQALWAYSVANDSRVPFVKSPMTNGTSSVPGFGQKNVADTLINAYDSESFCFLDGRPMHELGVQLTGAPMIDAQKIGSTRGTYLRDLVLREGDRVIGPHDGGINVINRDFGVVFRNQTTANADLVPNGTGGVRF